MTGCTLGSCAPQLMACTIFNCHYETVLVYSNAHNTVYTPYYEYNCEAIIIENNVY